MFITLLLCITSVFWVCNYTKRNGGVDTDPNNLLEYFEIYYKFYIHKIHRSICSFETYYSCKYPLSSLHK